MVAGEKMKKNITAIIFAVLQKERVNDLARLSHSADAKQQVVILLYISHTFLLKHTARGFFLLPFFRFNGSKKKNVFVKLSGS